MVQIKHGLLILDPVIAVSCSEGREDAGGCVFTEKQQELELGATIVQGTRCWLVQEQSVMVMQLYLVWKYNLVASETSEEFCLAA